MSIHNAKKFISSGMKDAKLRNRLNSATTMAELLEVITGYGLSFTPEEFEEAYRNRLVQCQFEEQADQLREFKLWWDLLLGMLGNGPAATPGICNSSATCSAGGCAGCGG
jgi:hypothetical protein